jgi:hypothetical protein
MAPFVSNETLPIEMLAPTATAEFKARASGIRLSGRRCCAIRVSPEIKDEEVKPVSLRGSSKQVTYRKTLFLSTTDP